MKEIIKKISKYVPYFIKRYVGKIVNIPIAHNTIFKYYQNKYGKVRLLFNNGDNKEGYLTVGYHEKCDIKLDENKPIRLYFDDKSVDMLLVENFVEQIKDELIYEDFLSECYRLQSDNSKLTLLFVDSKYALLEIDKNKLDKKEWTIRRRYLQSNYVTQLNTLFLDPNGNVNRFLDYKTVQIMLEKNGFKIITKQYMNGTSNCLVTCIKDSRKFNLLNLANLLPTGEKDNIDCPVYLFNCDSIQILNNFKNINIEKLQGRNFASVIGSLFFLNLIPYIKPDKVLLFDINDYQVRYMKLIVEIIKISYTFEEFVENFFVRKYVKNTSKFLNQKYDIEIYNKIKNNISDNDIFNKTIKKIAYAKFTKLNYKLPALMIDNNSMCQSITILDNETFKPGPSVNVVYRSSDFAKHYKYVRKALNNSEIKKMVLEDIKIMDFIRNDGILYVSNIGEEDWIYDCSVDIGFKPFEIRAREMDLSRSFREQWKNSYEGFKGFLNNIEGHFWIIDSQGNIFNSQKLLNERSDSHQWLWNQLKPQLVGKTLEIIHKKDGKWGFHEHIKTVNFEKYVRSRNNYVYDTVVLHILLGNGISFTDFCRVLYKASIKAKRIIVLEHDRDSKNFGEYSSPNIIDVRNLLKLIRSVKELEESSINVSWSGASTRIDKNKFGNAANYNRNMIVKIDL